MLLPGGLCAGWAGLAGAPGCFRNANGGGGGGGGGGVVDSGLTRFSVVCAY